MVTSPDRGRAKSVVDSPDPEAAADLAAVGVVPALGVVPSAFGSAGAGLAGAGGIVTGMGVADGASREIPNPLPKMLAGGGRGGGGIVSVGGAG